MLSHVFVRPGLATPILWQLKLGIGLDAIAPLLDVVVDFIHLLAIRIEVQGLVSSCCKIIFVYVCLLFVFVIV